MNVSRGLFRVWIVVSVLWLLGTIALAWSELPSQIAGTRYSYVYEIRDDIDVSKIDWNKSIYELMRSRSRENLSPKFAQLEREYWSDWDKRVENGTIRRLQYPHGKLYLDGGLTQAD